MRYKEYKEYVGNLRVFTPSAYGITGLSNTGAYRIYTFTDPTIAYTIAHQFFSLTPIYALLVGGGGGGGVDQGRGGGGGGIIQLTTYVAAGVGSITLNVGAATANPSVANSILNGNNTLITFNGTATTYTAYGGGGGGRVFSLGDYWRKRGRREFRADLTRCSINRGFSSREFRKHRGIRNGGLW